MSSSPRSRPSSPRRWSTLAKPFGRFAGLAGDEYAISCKINTKKGSERIVRAAFEFAKKHGRKKVTVVHKANVVRATDGLFLEAAKKVAKDYPDIEWTTRTSTPSACGCSRTRSTTTCSWPRTSTATSSPTCARRWWAGSASAAPGNIGEKLAVFEPTHGSAPKYAGKYKVNPIATILAAKMMLDWLGETEKAERLERAVAAVIEEGRSAPTTWAEAPPPWRWGKAIVDRAAGGHTSSEAGP